MKSVTIYSTETCPYCTMAKRFLKEKNIEFVNYDVGSDEQKAKEMMDKSGQMGVPVLDIGGTIIVGFNKEEILHALGL